MKKLCLLLTLCTALAAQAQDRLVDKAERGSRKAGEVLNEGIDKGAAAANKGVNKAFGSVNDKVLRPADQWIQRKVGNGKTGAQNTPAPSAP